MMLYLPQQRKDICFLLMSRNRVLSFVFLGSVSLHSRGRIQLEHSQGAAAQSSFLIIGQRLSNGEPKKLGVH